MYSFVTYFASSITFRIIHVIISALLTANSCSASYCLLVERKRVLFKASSRGDTRIFCCFKSLFHLVQARAFIARKKGEENSEIVDKEISSSFHLSAILSPFLALWKLVGRWPPGVSVWVFLLVVDKLVFRSSELRRRGICNLYYQHEGVGEAVSL